MDRKNNNDTGMDVMRRESSSSARAVQAKHQKGPQMSLTAEGVTGLSTKLHKSEISIFQQLCLDKHDENAAIEILLEDRVPDVLTASSTESTVEAGSRALSKQKASSVEGKRTFLNRFFFKSPRKSPQRAGGDKIVTSPSSSSETSPPSLYCEGNGGFPCPDPVPPSMVPRSRSMLYSYEGGVRNDTFEKSRSVARCQTISRRDRSERSNAFSNVSSLSGSELTSYYKPPMRFNRNESLGVESVKDVRTMLKRMEHQLSKASNNGQRISREKVVEALFIVADSLDDDGERHDQNKHSQEIENGTKAESHLGLPVVTEKDDDSDSTTSNEDFSVDRSAFAGGFAGYDADQSNDSSSPFNSVPSLEDFFGTDSQDQESAAEVLDDLMWTEFVSTRQEKRSTGRDKASSFYRTGLSANQLQSRQRHADLQRVQLNNGHSRDRGVPDRGRWWRTAQGKRIVSSLSNNEEKQITRSLNDRTQPTLPATITVKQKSLVKVQSESARKGHASSQSLQTSNLRFVDTDSHFGFEMDKVPSSRYCT
mmetsp:Transcript_31338/g.75799  ORF Transcript_31338/g.75799 Transcript_31338/m.75799 type:complete len:537 (-) Transcript_31338:1044-2654(-)